ncbi:Cof-type HAD-IIB family hydrolase [Streptococcus macacae]|uniref:Cof-like hydrolase n=1 Tax=Streptococcus macacae NCTC 11558 TaxID=764298 RepID=G5JWU2_9STRE|nr:Cof-type HAD-IIB family hydrolase [Streptococcus macacae]EHJ52928.1 Cof-like hydrolase [Streptococcus macacae NCTC 11558]SUN79050.1 haloacid dehalogenase [Streptococcus macacae NCTC 11558]
MVKLIAIDMDGTLLDSQKELSQRNIETLQKAAHAGYKIVICTGRAQSGVEPYFAQLALSDEQEYAVLNNGCSLHTIDEKWQLLACHSLAFDDISILYHLLEQKSGIYLTLIVDSDYLVVADKVADLVAYDASLVFTTPKTTTLEELKHLQKPVFKAMYMGEPDKITAFQKENEAKLKSRLSTVRSQDYLFEVLPKGINKASGLKEIAHRLQIPMQDVMAIGDAANDLEMMAAAGFSVAMGNASPDVKAVADFVTKSNDEAGVAQAINDHLFQKNL